MNLLIATKIKGGKLDRYQSLQIKALIQIPVKITEMLAVSKAAGQKIGKWTGNYIRQIKKFNLKKIIYFKKESSHRAPSSVRDASARGQVWVMVFPGSYMLLAKGADPKIKRPHMITTGLLRSCFQWKILSRTCKAGVVGKSCAVYCTEEL